MRWLVGMLVLSGCAGDGGPEPDVVFDVKITNTEADCGKKLGEGGLTQAGMTDALEAIWPLSLGAVPTDFAPARMWALRAVRTATRTSTAPRKA